MISYRDIFRLVEPEGVAVVWAQAWDWAKYGLALGIGLVLSLALTPPARSLARRLGMLDQPGGRRIHEQPTPRGGGLAVVLAFHLTLLGMWLLGWEAYAVHLNLPWWLAFLQATAVLVIVGFMDDKFGLSAWLKLAGQIVAATIMYAHGYSVESLLGFQGPEWFNYLSTLGWFVILTNAFNLIDGLDGLAAGLATIAAVGLAGAALLRGLSGDALPLLALAGACLGFLRYNFHPASVFLGDSGSLFLGFALASMSLASSTKGTLITALTVPLLAMGVPLYDTLLAVWRRSVRYVSTGTETSPDGRVRIMQADRDHLHHRFLSRGFGQRRAAMLLYGLNVALVALALLMTGMKSWAVGLFMLALVAWAYLMFRHLARIEVWETGRLIVKGFSRPRRRQATIVIYGLWDLAGITLAWTCAFWALGMSGVGNWLQTLVLMGAPLVVFLQLGRVYTRVWSRARLREYALLGLLVAAGAVCGAALQTMAYGWDWPRAVEAVLVVLPLVAIFIGGGRMGLRLLHEALAELEASQLARAPVTERVLAYGAGGRFQLFLRLHLMRQGRAAGKRVIVGVADDDPNLRGCSVSGLPVLGGGDDLETAIRANRITCVVVTCSLDAPRLARAAAACRAAGVSLREWRHEEREVSPQPPPGLAKPDAP